MCSTCTFKIDKTIFKSLEMLLIEFAGTFHHKFVLAFDGVPDESISY